MIPLFSPKKGKKMQIIILAHFLLEKNEIMLLTYEYMEEE